MFFHLTNNLSQLNDHSLQTASASIPAGVKVSDGVASPNEPSNLERG